MFLLSSLEDLLFPLVLIGVLGLTFLCLLPFIISTTKMTNAFNSLQIGMTYKEVIDIMGQPKREHLMNDDIVICTWRKRPIRGVCVIRTAYFRKGILESLSKDGTYS